jgi:hypothetical protein
MKRLPKNIALLLALTSATLITLLSCGGGGGGGGQASGKTSTIRGHVAGVSTAVAPLSTDKANKRNTSCVNTRFDCFFIGNVSPLMYIALLCRG